MRLEGFLEEYRFEIDSPDGLVSEKCILDGEKVVG
jgi:hypothetical protein